MSELNQLLQEVDLLVVPADEPNSWLKPAILSDSNLFFYYQLGLNTQEEWYAIHTGVNVHNQRQIKSGGVRVNAVGLTYTKPSFGYFVERSTYIVTIGQTSHRLVLEPTSNRAEFLANCEAFVSWCTSLNVDQVPRYHPNGAWTQTGFTSLIFAPGIGKSYYIRGGSTSTIQPGFAVVSVERNAYGPYAEWTMANYAHSMASLTDIASVTDLIEGDWVEGDSQQPANPPLSVIVDRSSKVYHYLRTVRYGAPNSNNSNSQLPSGGGGNMPWLSIIMFLLSFVLSKKSGRSTSASLLTGLAVGGATYALADPSNPDNLFKIGVDGKATASGTTPPVVVTPTGSASGSTLGSAIGGAVTATGNVLSNMGPGTAALIGGATGLAVGGNKNLLLIAALAVGALLLLKD